VIESLAILDYLEARYPELYCFFRCNALARVRMVQLVTLNELPAVFKLLVPITQERSAELEYAQLRNQYIEFLGESVGRLPLLC